MFNRSLQQPLLEEFYREFLRSENSADFILSVSREYTLPTLRRLTQSNNRITRRAAVLAIGFLGDGEDNQLLGQALSDRDRAVRLLADHGIRQIWFRVGNRGIENGLRRVARLNNQRRFVVAAELASHLIDLDPNVAETWNQRAIALYQLEDFSHSLCDCQRTIDLNSYHFLAALGMANCHLELGDVIEAIDGFQLALDINPDLEMVRTQIDHLQRIVEGG